MQRPQDYSNLFLDMNAFFASVEQQVQPALRRKPVCIAPYIGDTGCCIAKSYEAKKFGIQTGVLVGEAKKLCPQILILASRPELYLFYHREILKVLESFSPFVRVLSIDEFNIKLTGLDQNRPAALKMAQNIKKTIRDKVGDYLSCSVGIGPNRWLAKVAGELKKPDGLVVLSLEELPALYRSLALIDLPGINVGMLRQLRYHKIKTPFDFYQSPLANLSRWFGHPGRLWYYRLRGFEVDDLRTITKSIGHSHVLAPEYRSLPAGRRVLVKMTHKAGARLRAKKLSAGGVSIGINFLAGGSWQKNLATDLLADSQSLIRIALSLYDTCPLRKPPLRLGVTLFNLKEIGGRQISLFLKMEKSFQLSRAMDKINDRFGQGTIYPAAMFSTDDAVPDRIPFGDPERLGF